MAELPPILQQPDNIPPEFQPIFKKPSEIPEETGWLQTYFDSFVTMPFSQMAASHQDFMRPRTGRMNTPKLNAMNIRGQAALALTQEPIPDDPSFDLEQWLRKDPNRIRWADKFQDVYSEAAANNVWGHIKDVVDRKERLNNSDRWTAKILGSLSTPDVALPIGSMKTGIGFLNGFLRGAGTSLPYLIANEAIALKYDPTATLDESKQRLLYGTAIMGLIGGGFGFLGKGQTVSSLSQNMIDETKRIIEEAPDDVVIKDPDVIEFLKYQDITRKAEKVSDPNTWTAEQKAAYASKDYETFSRLRGYSESEIADYNKYQKLYKIIEAKYGENIAVDLFYHPETFIKSISQTEKSFVPYIARPTGITPTGFASAKGFERIAARQSGWARVANSGVRAYEDLANRFFGDGGVLFARNRMGIATEPSAFLAAEGWIARAADTILDIKSLHANYLTDGLDSTVFAGINVRSGLASMGDKVRKIAGRERMDGKLRTDEFEKTVFDTYIAAQKTGVIDHPIPQIKKAAMRLDQFFQEFAEEAYKTNYIKGPEHEKYLRRIESEYNSINKEIDNLNKIEQKTELQENVLKKLNNFKSELEKELRPILKKEEVEALIKEKEDKIKSLKDNAIEFISLKKQKFIDKLEAYQTKIDDLIYNKAPENLSRTEIIDSVINNQNPYLAFHVTNNPEKIIKNGFKGGGTVRGEPHRDIGYGEWVTVFNVKPLIEQLKNNPKFLSDVGIDASQVDKFLIERMYGESSELRITLDKNEYYYELLKNEKPISVIHVSELSNFYTKRHIGMRAEELGFEVEATIDDRIKNDFLSGKLNKDTIKDYNLPPWESVNINDPDSINLFFNNLQKDYGEIQKQIKKMQKYNPLGLSYTPKQKTYLDSLLKDKQKSIEIINLYETINFNDNPKFFLTKNQNLFFNNLKKEVADLTDSLKSPNLDVNFYADRKPLKFYFPHRWDRSAVLRNEDKLKEILTTHFEKTAKELGYFVDSDSITARVESTINNILGRVEDDVEEIVPPKLSGEGRAFFTRARQLDIPTELIKDFIDTDLLSVLREYSRKAGLGIEYTRAFDTPTGELAINRASIQAAKEGKSLKEISKYEDDIRTVRDILMARNNTYDTIGNKEAKIIKSWFTLTSMGKAIFANMVEVARIPWVLGIQETFGYALKALENRDIIKGMTQELRERTSGYGELTLGLSNRRFIENGPDSFASLSKYDRTMSSIEKPLSWAASAPYYLLNGVGPLTFFLKNYTGFVASDILARRIFKVAEGKATKKELEFLASYSISQEDALRIASEPFEKDRGLIFTNSTNWKDKNSVTKFFSAVESIQRRVITTPSAADKPNIVMGVLGSGATKIESQMLTLPFQLKGWGFAANNKILLSALQGRDANVMAGALGMFGIAYLMNMIKTPDFVWQKQSEAEKLLKAFESSGIAGIYGDINFMAETASQDTIGIRPLFGMEPKFGQESDAYDAAGEITGPGVSKIFDIVKAFNGGVPKDKARETIRAIPLNDLFWIPNKFRVMARKSLEEAYR
ncbi:MAG: hypothetical protein RJA03_389 [Pseudomonadota bacterium]